MTILNKFIYLALVFAGLNLGAQENCEPPKETQESSPAKDTSTFDIKIQEVTYQRPQSPLVFNAGIAKAEVFKMSTENVDVVVENKDEVFDALITYKDGRLGFKGETFGFAQKLTKDSFLSTVTKAQAVQGKLFKNLDYIKLESQSLSFDFEIEDEKYEFSGENLFLNCNIPSEAAGIGTTFTASCLGDSILKANSGENFKFFFNFFDETVDFRLDATLNNLKIGYDRAQLNTKFADMMIDDEFRITITPIEANCAKEKDVTVFDSEKIMKDCFTDIEFKTQEVAIHDLKSSNDSVFRIFPGDISIKDKVIQGDIPKFMLDERTKGTSFNNMTMKCFKSDETYFYDYYTIFEDCFKEGEVIIDNIRSEKHTYYKLVEDELKKIRRAHKADAEVIENAIRTTKSGKKPMVRNIKIDIADNKFTMFAELKVLGMFPDVKAWGEIAMNKETGEIAIDIEDVKAPLGIGKGTTLRILKIALKDIVKTGTMRIENKIIYIKV